MAGSHRSDAYKKWLRIIALCAPLSATAMVAASPDPLDPKVVTSPHGESRAEEAGSYQVNSQTGAAGYSYGFKMPPSRGVVPSLGLSYSSAGAIRGDVA